MRETSPAPDVLSSIFPAPCLSAQWESTWRRDNKFMQTAAAATTKARSHKFPDPRMIFKASNMAFIEMVEMVDIFK
ncbi:hypothetical protein AB205_0174130 [Aquarana catesbeiana]|uniref:Uncharacterized protein n=1 Tax=Aquarana catesbeiana TaxID=8400 RepID=A0A2G9RAP5_AQUCT|nr:hypothetical protein AB205_0174130 [Aquarana catesbeiana]